MAGPMVFVYALLVCFILSGASRNAKLRRPNPPIMQYTGYVLCGVTGGISLLLFGIAALSWFGFAALSVPSVTAI
ncbi:MAG: hypothetical protein JO221_02245 [Sphingomonas sp.]|uniref:Uncharacterized protein n=1 Tax=Sphingomonas lycopersici TaxID=2951807 RepID=A0AA42CSB2_9SPHN|nr:MULTISPECIES: hypothetical protein [Sphingomonas]MBV8237569.1 hypothetical protein [Sphingomonas sp.]MCW6532704.1 hypothetical protein [Sphingomonas lycopersici]MCW6537575.1 hypothetical protein [Sphingomonas lycopersici]OJU16354.1 MAG: hypothetical protein BGN95_04295 [Sphingomonas sp. 66-10]